MRYTSTYMCEILHKTNSMSKVSKTHCTDFNALNTVYVGDVRDGVCGFYATLYAEYRYCTVPFSLFADPERILRRLYVFAEEPCKSTNTTSEPCSPVFKEAQPRPSEHSNLEYHINNSNLYLYVFGLFSIFCNKTYPTRL